MKRIEDAAKTRHDLVPGHPPPVGRSGLPRSDPKARDACHVVPALMALIDRAHIEFSRSGMLNVRLPGRTLIPSCRTLAGIGPGLGLWPNRDDGGWGGYGGGRGATRACGLSGGGQDRVDQDVVGVGAGLRQIIGFR